MRVLVTGATRGIGRAIAVMLHSDGHEVVGTYRTSADDLPSEIRPVLCDVADDQSVATAISTIHNQYGPIDAVVANAGITRDTLLMRMSEEAFEDVLNTNLTGVFRVIQGALPDMVAAGGGRIVVIGSASGLSGMPGQVNYTAAKSAVIGLVRSIARECGPDGITANVVAPGFTITDMTDEAVSESVRAQVHDMIPVRRFGSPDEIAGAVSYLLGPTAGYVSGVVLNVDGGLGMGH